jgi:hypothetical protein
MNMDTDRKFEVEGLGEFVITLPTAEEIRQGDWKYSKTYNEALLAGITTQGEMLDILKRRNIIGEKYDERGEELKVRIGEKIVEMETETDKDKRRQLAIEVSDIRQELFSHNQLVNGPLANTCEQMSEDARLDYITSCIVKKADGTPVWSSYEEYSKEENRAFSMRARFEVLLYMQGLDPDFLEKVPENLVIRELIEEEKAAEENKEADVAEVKEEPKKAPAKPKRPRARKSKATEEK